MEEHEAIKQCIQSVEKNLEQRLHYSEANYQNALIHFLQKSEVLKTYNVMREIVVSYKLSDNFVFGHGRMDILLENDTTSIIMELKAGVGSESKNMRKYFAQCSRYMTHYETTNNKIGYVIIFNSGCSAILKKLPS